MNYIERCALLLTLVIFALVTEINACEVDDILEMVAEDQTASKIAEECRGPVIDAPSCTVRKIVRLANDDKTKQEILRQCGTKSQETLPSSSHTPNYTTPAPMPVQQLSNICQTPTFWCAIPQSAFPGTPCYCGWPAVNGMIVSR